MVMSLLLQRAQHGNAGGGLADLRRRAEDEEDRGTAIRRILGGRRGELPDIERPAVVSADGSEILDRLVQMTLREGAAALHLTHDAALGEHPIMVSRDEPAGRNAAHRPAGRFAIAR